LNDLRNQDPSQPNSWLVGTGGSAAIDGGHRGRFIRSDEADRENGSDDANAQTRTSSAMQSCGGGMSDHGVRMPERPAAFLKSEKDRMESSCSFFE